MQEQGATSPEQTEHAMHTTTNTTDTNTTDRTTSQTSTRRLTRAGAFVAAAAVVAGTFVGLLGSATPASATAADTASVQGAFTDNYKASYNGDPNAYDLRTWLAFHSITVGGVAYTPATIPAAISFVNATDGMAVKDANGNQAVLTASTTSTNVFNQGFFRIDPNGDFGLLQQENSRAALQTAAIPELLTVSRGGVALGSLTASYTYADDVFNVPSTSIEYHGPGGRWWVAGAPTRLNWEATAPVVTPPPATDTHAPTLTSVIAPATVPSRIVRVRLVANDDVAVTQVRFANEDGTWGAWKAYSATTTTTLSSSRVASKGFTAQVRDAAGNESNTIYSRISFKAGHDLDGDNVNDIIVRRSDGLVLRYSGSGTGGLKAGTSLFGGANALDLILITPDLDGDGKTDVVARKTDGTLRLYPGNGAGGVTSSKQIGTGWGTITAIVAPGDFDGDAKADLLARRSDGTLWLYAGNGAAGFAAPKQIGTGWATITAIVGAGDQNSDGTADLQVRKADGTLWLYAGNGTGGFLTPKQSGSGWASITIVGSQDLDDDNKADLVARKSDGTLWLYQGNGAGGFSGSAQIAGAWGAFTAMA